MENFGDVIDKLITMILGIGVLIYGIKPSLFHKKEESIQKLKKIKLVFLIGGPVLILFSLLQIIIYLNR